MEAHGPIYWIARRKENVIFLNIWLGDSPITQVTLGLDRVKEKVVKTHLYGVWSTVRASVQTAQQGDMSGSIPRLNTLTSFVQWP